MLFAATELHKWVFEGMEMLAYAKRISVGVRRAIPAPMRAAIGGIEAPLFIGGDMAVGLFGFLV